MKMKIQYTLFLALLSTIVVQAQIEVPIQKNPIIQRAYAEWDSQYPKAIQYQYAEPFLGEKAGCEIEREGVTYLEAGRSATINIDIDTFGLGPGVLECGNCDDLQFGSLELDIENERFTYTSFPGTNSGQEFVTIQYCTPGGSCPGSQTFEIIVKRPGTNYFPPTILMEGGSREQVTADINLLEGPLACSFFVECPDNYQGREQLVYFTTYNRPDNEIVYDAARYSGIDSVCLVLCDTFIICDTFHFSFRVTQDTLDEFPILDDFSYQGPYPAEELWLDREAFVNTQYGIDAPSVGVATLDGIDYRGNAYPNNQATADRLTSTYLDLSNQSGDLYINYWLQRKGLGDRPEPADSLVLQFKRNTGTWETIQTLEGAPLTQPNSFVEPFVKYSTYVPSNFRHKGFQFRFQAYSDNKGIQDTWNLDYVRIDDDSLSTFNDVAFSNLPNNILATYTSMPWRHFMGNTDLLAEDLQVDLYNHFIEPKNVAPSYIRLREINSNVTLYEQTLLNGLEQNVENGVPINRTYNLPTDNAFSNSWSNYVQTMAGTTFDPFDQLEFRLEYLHELSGQQLGQGFEATLINDFVESSTFFDNYFAYDLGIAESGIALQETWEVAVKYTTEVSDSLQAIRFHFPHTTANIEEQDITLKVWIGELDDTPEYELPFIRPSYTSSFYDTLQGFTTYPLIDDSGEITPLFLPAGDFYVGWEQESACSGTACVAVGLDKNRPQGADFIFRNLGTGWGPYPSFLPRGALMIRPVVGNERQGFTNTNKVAEDEKIMVYPNPAKDWLQVDLPPDQLANLQYELYDGLGQRLQAGQLERQIDLSKLPGGMYILRIIDWEANKSQSQRVVILE
jgi:hypothetical protein